MAGQHVIPAVALPRILQEAFPLPNSDAAGTSVASPASKRGRDDVRDKNNNRLELLSRQIETLKALIAFKLWNKDSAVRKWLKKRLLSVLTLPFSLVYRIGFIGRMQAQAEHNANIDFVGGEPECIARIKHTLRLLSAELGSDPFFGKTAPSAVDAQLFGVLMDLESSDPVFSALLFEPSSSAGAFTNLSTLRKRIYTVQSLQTSATTCFVAP